MKKKIAIIIFSYRRAIILNEVLKSIFKNFKQHSLPIHVIYHYDSEHHFSYQFLEKKWKKKGVIFYQREKMKIYSFFKFFLFHPWNFLWILRWHDILKNFNNFKTLLEKILFKTKEQFVTLVPDDQIFYKKTLVPSKALKILLNDNNNYFYRFFTGDHFKNFNYLPKNLLVNWHKEKSNIFFEWSNNLKRIPNSPLWSYRFTIEGTVYNRKTLLNLISPLIYHNPITLEAIGLWESRFRNFFKNGMSSKERTAAGYQINSVQKHVFHYNFNFCVNKLMRAYLRGYRLVINQKDFDKNNFNIVPKNIFLKKEKKKKINYKNLIL
jgi:hypothetical protein